MKSPSSTIQGSSSGVSLPRSLAKVDEILDAGVVRFMSEPRLVTALLETPLRSLLLELLLLLLRLRSSVGWTMGWRVLFARLGPRSKWFTLVTTAAPVDSDRFSGDDDADDDGDELVDEDEDEDEDDGGEARGSMDGGGMGGMGGMGGRSDESLAPTEEGLADSCGDRCGCFCLLA